MEEGRAKGAKGGVRSSPPHTHIHPTSLHTNKRSAPHHPTHLSVGKADEDVNHVSGRTLAIDSGGGNDGVKTDDLNNEWEAKPEQ